MLPPFCILGVWIEMKQKTKAIGTRLKNVKTYQSQQKVLSEWSSNWEDDQTDTIYKLRWAAQHDDHGQIMHMIDQLQGMTNRRFTALNNVLRTISDPDRKLKDLRECDEESEASATPAAAVEPDPPAAPPAVEIAEPKEPPDPPRTDLDVGEMVKCYNAGMAVKEIAQWNNITVDKTIKILVTEGVYTSEVYDQIKHYRERGKTEKEISDLMDIGKSAMNRYTPYKKGLYNSESPSVNASRIRKSREKRRE